MPVDASTQNRRKATRIGSISSALTKCIESDGWSTTPRCWATRMIMFHHHRWHLILVHLVPQRPGQRLLQIEKQPEDRHVNEFQFWDRQNEKEIEGDVAEELHGIGQLEWVSIEVVMVSGAAESVVP